MLYHLIMGVTILSAGPAHPQGVRIMYSIYIYKGLGSWGCLRILPTMSLMVCFQALGCKRHFQLYSICVLFYIALSYKLT